MEDDLDEIAAGTEEQVPWLERFYFGDHAGRSGAAGRTARPLARGRRRPRSEGRRAAASRRDRRPGGELDPARDRRRRAARSSSASAATAPTCSAARTVPPSPRTWRPTSSPWSGRLSCSRTRPADRVLGDDPRSGKPVLVRAGRFGPYVQLGEAGDGAEKPRTASLFKSMTVDGRHARGGARAAGAAADRRRRPETGEEIVAANGRYGPYLKRGNETREPRQRGAALHRHPRGGARRSSRSPSSAASAPRRRRFASSGPIRTRGRRSCCDRAVSGRMSPTGRRTPRCGAADDPDTLTLERAAELLADRRAAGPGQEGRRAAGRRVSKKAGARKATGATKKAGGPQGHRRDEEGRRAQGPARRRCGEEGRRRARRPVRRRRRGGSEPGAATQDDAGSTDVQPRRRRRLVDLAFCGRVCEASARCSSEWGQSSARRQTGRLLDGQETRR